MRYLLILLLLPLLASFTAIGDTLVYNNGDKIKIMVTSDKTASSVTAVMWSITAFQIP